MCVRANAQVVQALERVAILTPQQVQLARSGEHRLVVVCLRVGDVVPHRLHWPTHCELRVNSLQYRVYARNPVVKAYASTRDEPANISACRRAVGLRTPR